MLVLNAKSVLYFEAERKSYFQILTFRFFKYDHSFNFKSCRTIVFNHNYIFFITINLAETNSYGRAYNNAMCFLGREVEDRPLNNSRYTKGSRVPSGSSDNEAGKPKSGKNRHG